MLLISILLITLFLTSCDSRDKIEPVIEQAVNTAIEEEYYPWHTADIDSLEKVIYDVAYALKIPYGKNSNRFSPNIYPNIVRYEDKSSNNPRQIYLRFMLNREIVDLTYANIILKQGVEKANGKLVDGIFFTNWKDYLVGQKLTFRNYDESVEYIIRLVFDKSPYSDVEQSKEIAIILTEIGNNEQIINDNLDFIKSHNLTLAIYGDGTYSRALCEKAVSNNIETMLTIPLESYPSSQSFYQQNAIKVENPIEKQQIWSEISSLHNNLPGVSGLTHYWGNFASSEADFMQHVIDYSSEHKLYYIDAMTTSKSKGFELALRSQVLSSWALSYNQATPANLSSYLNKNSNPVLILPFNTPEDVAKVRKIISLVDRKQFKIVNVSELLNTDLPIIE